MLNWTLIPEFLALNRLVKVYTFSLSGLQSEIFLFLCPMLYI